MCLDTVTKDKMMLYNFIKQFGNKINFCKSTPRNKILLFNTFLNIFRNVSSTVFRYSFTVIIIVFLLSTIT